MYKVCVVADEDVAVGFRLAGVEAHSVGSKEEARKLLAELVFREDLGIIGVASEYAGVLDERTRKKAETGYTPIIVEIPHAAVLKETTEERRKRHAAFVSEAIGQLILYK